jgi:hypothetical protein
MKSSQLQIKSETNTMLYDINQHKTQISKNRAYKELYKNTTGKIISEVKGPGGGAL